jgi:hypothetical protein
MPETSTPDSEERIQRVYTRALEARSAGRELAPADQVVYEVEMLSQEVNSGASFEQYFRWASVDEISRIVARLEALALPEVAALTARAIAVAFPGGIPASPEEKDELTDWSAEQADRLGALASEFEEWNGRIMNALADFHRASGGGG